MRPHANYWESLPRIEAYIWYCGDEICDCTQPVIEKIEPNLKVGFPWVMRTRLWEGTFYSQPSFDERRQQDAELEEAKKIYLPKK